MAVPMLCNVFDGRVTAQIYKHAKQCKEARLYTGKDATLYNIMFIFEAQATMQIVRNAIPKGVKYTSDDVWAYCVHIMLGCKTTNAIQLWAMEDRNGKY